MVDQVMRASTETAVLVPEIWSGRFYDVLRTQLVFMDSVSRDYEGDIRALGNIVNIPSIPEFSAATDLTEGNKADADAVTITSQALTINKRAHKDFIITDQAQLQSIPFMDGVREQAVFAILKKIQADIVAAVVPNAAAPDHSIAYDNGSTLGLADILEGKELLDTANVPMDNRKMAVGAAQLNDLYNITGLVSRDFVPNGSPMASGAFGDLLGFQLLFTNAAGAVTHLFHPSFMTIALQKQLNVGMYDLGVDGQRAFRINCDVLWGLKQLDGLRVVTIS
jgi:hypothetical protein